MLTSEHQNVVQYTAIYKCCCLYCISESAISSILWVGVFVGNRNTHVWGSGTVWDQKCETERGGFLKWFFGSKIRESENICSRRGETGTEGWRAICFAKYHWKRSRLTFVKVLSGCLIHHPQSLLVQNTLKVWIQNMEPHTPNSTRCISLSKTQECKIVFVLQHWP